MYSYSKLINRCMITKSIPFKYNNSFRTSFKNVLIPAILTRNLSYDPSKVRNVAIIAHVDHGKNIRYRY